jgi:hypothetical protein
MVITWGKCDVRFSQLSADYQEVGEILPDERQHTSKREKYAGICLFETVKYSTRIYEEISTTRN